MKQICIFLLIFCTFKVCAVDFTVNDTVSFFDDTNPGDGICTTGFTSTCTLIAAIQETNALPGSHRILLNSDTYTSSRLPSIYEITNSDVEIVGLGQNSTVIDGNLDGPIFDIYNSNVTIKNLSIINGKGTVDNALGGAIYAYRGPLATADLLIQNVKFENNSANLGGALSTVDMNVTIEGSSFRNNRIEDLGVTNMQGSAISVRRGFVDIFSSSITSNTNGSDAIFITDSYITLQNSTVSDNDGIGLRTRNASARIHFSTISHNNYNLSHYSFDGTELMEISGSLVQNSTSANCFSTQKPTSLGYNISDDSTCELLEASDMEDTDAQLTPLSSDGATFLHRLAITSPAVDYVPLSSCFDISGTLFLSGDQVGNTRPFAATGLYNCDSGSMEVSYSDIIFTNGFE